ncbi:MAG: hypothetical protein V7739_07455 [Motiliproteus sp.]
MKTYVVYLLVAVACLGLFSILKDLEIGLLSAMVISAASIGCSYILVEMAYKLGSVSSFEEASLGS